MKMRPKLHAHFSSENLIDKTDFYHFSNMKTDLKLEQFEDCYVLIRVCNEYSKLENARASTSKIEHFWVPKKHEKNVNILDP